MVKARQVLSYTSSETANNIFSDEPSVAQSNELAKIADIANGPGIMNAVFNEEEEKEKENIGQLRDFCIKSSFNSAYSGGYMSHDTIKYVLSRGCRFLDFEVFMKDGIPIVAYSNSTYDPANSSFTSYDPALSLNAVFTTIISSGFAAPTPNPRDPLFIHLRIKSNLPEAFQSIAMSVDSILKGRLYKKNITPETNIRDLLGKVVLIIDKTASPGYNNYPRCTSGTSGCYDLKTYANIESGSDKLPLYKENQLTNLSMNPPNPRPFVVRIVLPDTSLFGNMRNSDSFNLIQNYGAQIIAQPFYIKDRNLTVYEELFRQYKSAFIPLSNAITYIQTHTI